MPANDGIRLDDDQTIAPVGKAVADQDPEAPICIAEPRSGLTALQNDELLPKAEILGSQSRFGLEDGGERVGKVPNHRKGIQVVLINRKFSTGRAPIL